MKHIFTLLFCFFFFNSIYSNYVKAQSDCSVTISYTIAPSGGYLFNATAFNSTGIADSFIYQWNLGDGTTDAGNPVDHYYSTSGVYEVCVVATSTSIMGCAADNCIAITVEGDCICSLIYDPVCAGGITFDNSCFAECEGYTTWTMGVCDSIPTMICEVGIEIGTTSTGTVLYEAYPVGSGVAPFTYLWTGGGAVLSTSHIFMPTSFTGIACVTMTDAIGCSDTECIEVSSPCITTDVFEPVCGVNGITYINASYAECEGVSYTVGPCDSIIPPPIDTAGGSGVVITDPTVIDTVLVFPDSTIVISPTYSSDSIPFGVGVLGIPPSITITIDSITGFIIIDASSAFTTDDTIIVVVYNPDGTYTTYIILLRLGTLDNIAEFEFITNVFPNPATDNIEIILSSNAPVQMNIRGVDGKTVYSTIKTPATNRIQVDINELIPGVYFVNMQQNNKSYYCKFIKK